MSNTRECYVGVKFLDKRLRMSENVDLLNIARDHWNVDIIIISVSTFKCVRYLEKSENANSLLLQYHFSSCNFKVQTQSLNWGCSHISHCYKSIWISTFWDNSLKIALGFILYFRNLHNLFLPSFLIYYKILQNILKKLVFKIFI